MDCCQFIADIKQDPAKQITGLKIKDFLALKEHITVCYKCADAVDEIIEREIAFRQASIHRDITRGYMKLQNVAFLFVGLLIGWLTVPSVFADGESSTYKALLHKMIDIITQVQINTAATADNTKAIREHLGAK